jgi:N-acetylglucosaminyl-diphospho-decaprenol L-rhamnosyltransferase
MLLSIVIVSWNTCGLLQSCLRSIYENPFSGQSEVWVVDNASNDDSIQMIKDQFPQVQIIENQENVGFAHGNNQAIRKSTGKYVMLLNPDTEIKPGALDRLSWIHRRKPASRRRRCKVDLTKWRITTLLSSRPDAFP